MVGVQDWRRLRSQSDFVFRWWRQFQLCFHRKHLRGFQGAGREGFPMEIWAAFRTEFSFGFRWDFCADFEEGVGENFDEDFRVNFDEDLGVNFREDFVF